jgi:hypothetical protein
VFPVIALGFFYALRRSGHDKFGVLLMSPKAIAMFAGLVSH